MEADKICGIELTISSISAGVVLQQHPTIREPLAMYPETSAGHLGRYDWLVSTQLCVG